ncbi:peptidoglycan DD-metalloendopeptidase family protein [Micromonospora sp. DT81.3]|uniref:M23 family metallopeptidase n=1 Tax=Actinomycetes TaxID=1760 RepID=UPI003CEAE6C1
MKGELAGTVEDCGCAPTESERRSFLVPVSRRTALGLAAFGAVALGTIGGPMIPAAFAATYPSWDDVQNALANEAVKAGEVARIEGLIASLTEEVERTRTEAEARADEYYVAQQEFYDAAYRADELQSQADEQAALALESAQKAGRVAAQLYRNGGDDTSLELFFAGSAANADDLLARLGTMDKMVERNQAVYSDAIKARDSAQSLSDQAIVARTERDRLQQVAEQKMIESQAAADAAQAALEEQEQHLADLEAQLEALMNTSAKTVAEYEAGVEAERLAAIERQRQADLRAQQLAIGGGGGGVGGVIVGGGWARPSSGVRTSGYGPRTRQCGTGYCSSGFHRGVDLATGCGAAIYAANAGVVDYAGYNGGYGNYIRIDHGAGTGTGYAHIIQGGIRVSRGQWVAAGQLIALEGNTGNSFGCHLHFETYQNGYPVNPIDFMAARGISV